MRAWRLSIAAIAASAACRTEPPAPSPSPSPSSSSSPPEYLKGELHVHTNNSGDSATPPAEVARWYAAHHFDFIVFTDHNFVTVLAPADTPPTLLAIPGVELTQNLDTCVPPPRDPDTHCLLHVNALVTADTAAHGIAWTPPATPPDRATAYAEAIDLATQLGGIAQLNHPNFHWGADATLLAALARRTNGLRLFEVANESSDIRNEGDADHPSTEALWDAVLTTGATLFGTATDDAHQYADADAVRARGDTPDVGDRGWVMVRAARDPAAIRAALSRGEFYATTGIVLRRIARTGAGTAADALDIDVAGTDPVDTRFIGAGGRELARSHGLHAHLPLHDALRDNGYVRADLADAHGHRAWVQPIR